MKLKFIVFILTIGFFSAENASAYRMPFSTELVGRSRIGCGGLGCHATSASTSTSVSITEGASLSAAPGQTLNLTAIVAHATQKAAGVSVSVLNSQNEHAGDLIAGGGLKLAGQELFHSDRKAMNGGKAEFSFQWTAPAEPGTYTMYVAGNAVNSDGNSSGDAWNKTAVTITVQPASSVEENFFVSNFSALPNPFSAQTTFSATLSQPGSIEVSIVDAQGNFIRNIAQIENAEPGEKKFFWDGKNENGSECASGAYMAVIRSKHGITSTPVVIIR